MRDGQVDVVGRAGTNSPEHRICTVCQPETASDAESNGRDRAAHAMIDLNLTGLMLPGGGA